MARLTSNEERPGHVPIHAWLIVLAGYSCLYVPTYLSAFHTVWVSDENGHGPIVLLVCVGLFWTLRHKLAAISDRPAMGFGASLFALGLLLSMAGRALNILSIELGSQMLVVAGSLLLLKGASALRVSWFALIYIGFMVPLPAFIVDTVTGPLKHWISEVVVELLFALGYPVARAGVMITIGHYQLLVADACSGLNSMVSLTALVALYMYVVNRRHWAHNVVLALSMLPIAAAANVVRVTTLVLVTYHMGDDAGQGFLHGAAGLVLMLVALAAIFLVDAGFTAMQHMRRRIPATAM